MAANDVTSFLNSAEQYLKDKHAASFSDATWRAQKDVMEPLCSSDDSNVIGILPTGTGKSFIYQYYAREHNGSVLVIEPLNAIINDQVQGYNSEFRNGAYHLKRQRTDIKTDITSKDLRDLDPDLIYTSPETLYNSSYDIIRCYTEDPSKRLSMIVIDEAHTLLDWGLSFRDDYLFVIRFIREVRKNYKVRLLLLTATLNRMQLEYLECYLNLDLIVSPVIRPLPSRDKVTIVSDDSSGDSSLDMIIENIDKTRSEGCSLIFFNTTKSVEAFHARLYKRLEKLQKRKYDDFDEKEEERSRRELEEDEEYASPPMTIEALKALRGKDRDLLKRNTSRKGITSFLLDVGNDYGPQAVIANFYGSMTPQEKDERLNAIRMYSEQKDRDRASIVYILTTKALSMGIDMDSVSQVVNIGLPDSMSEYRQEIGRIRNPGGNTTYSIFCTQEEIQYEFNRLLPSSGTCNDLLSMVSARIKVWDYLSLWNWFQNDMELPDISLDEFLKLDSGAVLKIIEDLCPGAGDQFGKKIQSLFGKRINKKQISREAGKTEPRFLIHTSEAVLSSFGITKGLYTCRDHELDMFDYIVFNSFFTLTRQNLFLYPDDMAARYGSNWASPERNNTLAADLSAAMTGSLRPPREDKVNKERDLIISRINTSLDKLLDCRIEYTRSGKVRKLIDTEDLTFPLTDSLKNISLIGFAGSLIGDVLISDSKRTKITLLKLVAAHYTLLETELARRFFFIEISGIKNTSCKVPYFSPVIRKTLRLEQDTHYHRYQVPNLFKRYMQESLAGIYKEESSRIKGKPFYRQYRHRSPGEIYAASAQGAYGLLGDKAGSKAIENFSKDTKDNLIINRYWLTDNGKL